MTTQADGAAAALATYQKLLSLLVPAPPAAAPPATAPPAAAPPAAAPPAAAPPPPPVTNFAWAVTQMQAGLRVTRPSWGDKAAFLGSAGQELIRLPQGFPYGGTVVPWLYAPGDTEATDWEIAT
jgi:hypothetical protein